MALSGSQITGIGVIGFPSGAYIGFAAKKIDTPDATLGIYSLMSLYEKGVASAISDDGQGVLSAISQSAGSRSIIREHGKGVISTINDHGVGVEDKI